MEGKEKMLEWLQREGFCSEGIEWCDENCVSLDDMWEKIDTIYFQMDVAEMALSERDLYEFSLFCAEQIRHLMTDERSLQALDVRRKWLDGEASDKELNDAASAAYKVTFDVEGFAEEVIALSALCAVSSVWDVYGAATWAIKAAMFTGSDDVEEILFKKLKTFKPEWNI